MAIEEWKSRYIEKLAKEKPTFELVGEYKGTQIKTLHKCKICGYEWLIKPGKIFDKKYCPNCSKTIRRKSDDFSRDVEEKTNGKISALSHITKALDRVMFKCNVCGHIWEDTFQNIIRRLTDKCPQCYKTNIPDRFKINYINKIKEYNLQLLEEYNGATVKVKHKCLKCGSEFYVRPDRVRNSKGNICKTCKNFDKITTIEQYNNEIHKIFPKLEAYGDFTDIYSPVNLKCLDCGSVIYKKEARSVLRGHGCQRCSWNRKFLTHDEFVEKLSAINKNIIPVDKYIRNTEKIKLQCKLCGKTFSMRASAALNREGCPWCNRSKGENKIKEFFDEYGIEYIPQFSFPECKYKKALKFDFYLPHQNMCIEFDGKQHYKSIKYFGGDEALQTSQKRDKIKETFCRQNNIKLLRIRYDDDLQKLLNIYFNDGYIEDVVNDIRYMEIKEWFNDDE